MAEFRIPSPSVFDSNLESWTKWKQRLDIFLKASGKNSDNDDIKIAILLSVIGDEGLDVFNTFKDETKKSFKEVINAYDQHYLPKTNTTMETFKFNNLSQGPDQSIDQFLTELRKQARLCDFVCSKSGCSSSYEDRMIKDRLILGIHDKQIQQRLMREVGLDISKILDFCKSIELSKKHLKMLTAEEVVDTVKMKERKMLCRNCLYEHPPNRCPAFRKTCTFCGRSGHFARACNSRSSGCTNRREIRPRYNQKRVNSIGDENIPEEKIISNGDVLEREVNNVQELYIDQLQIHSNRESWYENLSIEGKNVRMKLDSGAESSILPKNMFDKLQLGKVIKQSTVTLVSYGNFRFKPYGEILLNCSFNNLMKTVNFIIVDFSSEPLLGLHDCLSFNLIKRVYNLNSLPNTKNEIYEKYKSVFEGLGKIPGFCQIRLSRDAKPVIQSCRKVPIALHDRLKQALSNLESKGVISRVSYPTDWVNALVIVEKPDKSLRICIDPKPLNKYIRREYYTIPTSTDIIGRLTGQKLFSVIDMKDGFHQLQLDEKSADLCAFSSPFGRYKFNRVPFGISSAPEIFQRKNHEIFGDIPGVNIYFDDLIISGKNDIEHDEALKNVLERASEYCVKFNLKKFQYKLKEVRFMGQIISGEGVRPDSDNIRAVAEIEVPTNKTELLRILGLVKFFSKFIPNLSQLTTNLRELTKKNIVFSWTEKHDSELNILKSLITSSPLLKIFDPNLEITIQCDASGDGLGCVLLQKGHPVSFASRCLTKAEKRYAQIEKELLAIVFACEKFHTFVYGHKVKIHSDHKPLIPIFSKDLEKVSVRLQRMLLKVLRYDIEIEYLPGREMYIADALSRSFLKLKVEDDPEMQYVVHTLYNNIPMSEKKKAIFKTAIDNDPCLVHIKHFLRNKWPDNDKRLSSDLKHYYKLKNDLNLSNDLIFFNDKVIVPTDLRLEMLKLVHEPHLGIEKTKLRARQILYWPKMSKDIESMVSNCETCQLNRRSNQKETMISHPIPSRPWQYLFSDFFEFNNKNYLLIIDSYSKWVEVKNTRTKTAQEVINFCKDVFSRFGVPDIFYSDNVPYNSELLQNFARKWNFELKFSSPYHHQSNGLAERYVGIIKTYLRKCVSDCDLASFLMEYRNNPLPHLKYSPSQLLLHRIVKTKIPVSSECLKPVILDPREIMEKHSTNLETQKVYYDKTAKDLKKLEKDDRILIQNGKQWVKGKVNSCVNDRSYIVQDERGGVFRRNRKFLNKTPLTFNIDEDQSGSCSYDFGELYKDSNDGMRNGHVDETDNSNIESASSNDLIQSSLPSSLTIIRTKRLRKIPNYLDDYYTN